MRRSLVWLVLVTGCGNVTGDEPPPPPTPSFTLALVEPALSVPLDGMARVAVEIVRDEDFTGAVALAGTGLPSGVVVTPATIAEGVTTGEVLVGGTAPLLIDARVTFTLEATGEGVEPKTVTLADLAVTGKPGSLDTSFGPGGGLATISFGADDGGTFTALDVVNGSVLATGTGMGGLGAIGFRTMRFTAAGALDPEWNGGAMVRTALGGGSGDHSESLAIGRQNDGRPIAIGFNNNAGNSSVGVVRYSLTGGAGGQDFGTLGGRSVVDLGGQETITDGVVLATSSIIAVGARDGHLLVTKLSASGFLDTAFAAPAGFERLVRGTASAATAATTDNQGRILVAGTFTVGGQTDALLLRYADNGTHDAGFGTDGEVVVPGADNERALAVRAAGDKIYLATMAGGAFRVRRYTAAGQLDAAFGAGGMAELVAGGVDGRDMVVLGDGRVVVFGAAGGQVFLGRLTRDGRVDTLFGATGTGTATVFIGDSGNPGAIAAYSAHQIVFCGGNEGGVPGPGTFGVVGRVWM